MLTLTQLTQLNTAIEAESAPVSVQDAIQAMEGV